MSATVSSAGVGRLPGNSGGSVTQYIERLETTTLNIRPGQGLGYFYLGASLYSILKYLRTNPSQYPHIEVVYSKESPIKKPIILKLLSNGLRLHFDGSDQSLRLIEVLDWGMSLRVNYKGTELGKGGGIVTFKQIYSKIFGPTYPGWFDRSSSRYILSYPGVAFSFLVPESLSSEEIIKYLSGTSSNNSRDGRGACLSMAIFKGHSWTEAQKEIFKPRKIGGGYINHDGGISESGGSEGSGGLTRNSISSNGGGDNNEIDDNTSSNPDFFSTIQIDHLQIHHTQGKCNILFSNHPLGLNEYEIILNHTTMQNVIMILGPPSERIFKQDSRLSIHNPDGNNIDNTNNSNNNNKSPSPNTDLFFNYFPLGFDLCFDTSLPDPFVKKIIIHGNVPSSLSFQVYNRCRWLLFPPDYTKSPITSESPFSKYSELFIPNTNPPLSMMLNRTIESPSSSVELVGEEEQTLSAADEDDWGSTQLYGCPKCIFEVLKNDTISSLTIF